MAEPIQGMGRFKAKLDGWKTAAKPAARAAVREWAERTLAVSKDGGEGYNGPICPVKDGHLISSGHVGRIRTQGKIASIEIGYGGPAAPYAQAVHAMRQGANFTKPRSGPGYLKQPALYMLGKAAEIITPHFKAFLK